MRIGQTSIIVFLAKFLGAALGFVATLAFARIVGAGVLGIYVLVLTITKWASFTSNLGIGSATTKRISEDQEPEAFLAAGVLLVTGIAVVVSMIIVAGRPIIESYVGGFSEYTSLSVIWFIVIILFINIFYTFPRLILNGERRVHIATLLEPIRQASQGILQIALVIAGFGLVGMLTGYIIGGLLVGLVGLYLLKLQPESPSVHHFKSLFDYAKYSWIGKLKSRVFNDIDILILGVFVPSAAVGIYTVAWSLSSFLALFGNSIRSTLFPEISYSSSQESIETVRGYVEDSLSYTGLVVIPGFVGGFLLAEELMLIYGIEFIDGAAVLWILILAILIYAYQKQFVNALNGIDRPDLSFRVNVLFAGFNAGLNLMLIPRYGIEGAAIASVASVMVAMALAYYYLNRLLTFTLPVGEISRQIGASLSMGVIVVLAQEAIRITDLLQHNILILLILVTGGAATYFLTLLAISPDFRSTIKRNLPITIPFIYE